MLRLPRVTLSPVTFYIHLRSANKHKSYRIKFNLRVNRVEDLNFHFIWRSMLPIRKIKSGHESEKEEICLRYDDFIGHLFLFEKSLEKQGTSRVRKIYSIDKNIYEGEK